MRRSHALHSSVGAVSLGCGIRARMADKDRLREVVSQYRRWVLSIVPATS